MQLSPGTRLGPYEIVAAIGSGGMGEVYKARDTRLDRTVAIKILQQVGGDVAHKIMREARAAARLNHPNITALHDVVELTPTGADAPLHFLVMEYVDGMSLSTLAAHGPCGIEQALDIAIQLADALAYAHRKGIIHRDVKPANVLITRDDKVKLLDLGIAQSAGSDPEGPTRTNTEMPVAPPRQGTPAYMAPEQLGGESASPRTDIYGAGILMYELLTGRRPYEAPDRIALAIAIATAPTPRVSVRRPDVPGALDAIVARAMAKEPDARYGTADELRDVLAAVRDALRTGSAPPISLATPKRRWVLRFAVTAVTVAAIAFASWMAVSRFRAPAAATAIAVLPALNPSEDPEIETLGTALVSILNDNLASTPGLTIVSANPGTYRGPSRDLNKAAAELGSGYLVGVAMRKAPPSTRVESQLLAGGKSGPLWHDQYDGAPLDVVRHVLEQLATALKPRQLFRGGLTDEARDRIRRLPTANADAFAAYLRGTSLSEKARDRAGVDQAIAAFEEATKRDPTFSLAFAGLSLALNSAYGYTRDPALAERMNAAMRQALDLDPTRALVREAAARSFRRTGQLERAEGQVREEVRIAPDSDSGRRLLALILFERHNIDAAVAEARAAIKLRPDYYNNHYTLGYIFYTLGRYQEALEPLERTTELQPDSSSNFLLLGTAYHQLGRVNDAIGNYALAIKLGANAQAYMNLGTAYYSAQRFGDALGQYREAAALNSSSPTVHRNLGDVYERLHSPRESRSEYLLAIARADDILRVNPQETSTMAQRAFCEAKLGQLDAAQRDIAAALVLTKRGVGEVLFKSAQIQAIASHPEGALQDLAEALKLGYSVFFAREDWDLRTLRTQPKFTALVNPSKE